MPVHEIKGLKGINDLSNEEYKVWRAAQVQAGKLNANSSWEREDRLYRNQQFIANYGNEAFSSMNKNQRDYYHEAITVGRALQDRFGNQRNFNDIMTLDLEGQKEFYENVDTDEDIAFSNNKLKSELPDVVFAPAVPGIGGSPYNKSELVEKDLKDRRKHNEETINYIFEKDRVRKAKDADITPYFDYINSAQIGGGTINIDGEEVDAMSYINDRMLSIGRGYETEESTAFGTVTSKNPGSRFYKAFEDTDYIKEMPASDKAKFVAAYDVLSKKYGEYVANQVLDTQMQQYIHDSQSGWEWALYDGKNIVLGGVANIMNKVMGLEAIGVAMKGDEELARFLSGVDEEGNLNGTWNNPAYWSGVDQYNTFDVAEINRANKNGGISPYQNIYAPGQEAQFFSWQTANEAIRMGKFLWSDYLTACALRGAGKGIGAGITKTAGATAAAGFEKWVVTPGIIAMSGVGISESYGKQTFDQTLQENLATLDETTANTVEKTIQDELMSDELAARINQMVKNEAFVRNNSNIVSIDGQNIALPQENFDEDAYRVQLYKEYANARRQALTEEIKNSEEYQRDKEMAYKRAADAYMVDATMEELRMTLTNSMWGQYKFDKGTRAALSRQPFADNVIFDTEGNIASNINKSLYTTKKILTPLWDGFQSNYLDDVTVAFGKGFGVGSYNNYMAKKYNTEQLLATGFGAGSDFLAGLSYASEGAKEALGDRQSWYDGWIGMLGSFTSVGGRFSASERPNYGLNPGEKRTVGQFLNSYINNPLIDAYYSSQIELNNFEEDITRMNQQLQKNKAQFEDIHKVIAGYQQVQAAIANDDHVQAKDAKIIGAIDLMETIDNWSNDPILSQSQVVQTAKSDMESILSGNLTEEEWNALEVQYRERNKNTEETSEEIRERISQNISDIKTTYDNYQQKKKEVEKSSKSWVPEEVKEHLAKTLVMEDSWNERVSSMEEAISGNTSINTTSSPEAMYGSKKAYDAAIASQENSIQSLEERLSEICDQQVALWREKTKPFSEERQQNKEKKTALELEEKTIKRLINKENAKLNEMQKSSSLFEDAEGNVKTHIDRVFSKDEIISLNPRERATMLSHPENYSSAQQEEISKAIAELRQKGDAITKMVMDIPRLLDRIEEAELIRDRLTDEKNAVAVQMYVDKLKENRGKNAIKAAIQAAKDQVFGHLDKATTFDELKNAAFNYGTRGVGSKIFSEYLESHKEMNTPEAQGLVTAIKAQEDAAKAIEDIYTKEEDKTLKATLVGQVYNIIKGANNAEEAINALEDALDAAEDPINKGYLNQILDKMTEMDYQRNATKIEARTKAEEKAASPAPVEQKERKEQVPTSTQEPLNTEDVDLGMVDSPSLQEQVAQASEGTVTTQLPNQDVTDGGNILTASTTSKDLLAGNPFMEYNTALLKSQGVIEHKKGAREFDTMSQFYAWLSENNIQMQEIIDNELGNILRANPQTKVKFLFRKPQFIKDHRDAIQDQLILVIENDEQVSKFHDKSRGSIAVDGKDYLVIGSIWADFNNPTQKETFISMQQTMQRNRKKYFDANPEALYYVDPIFETQVHQMTSGYITRQLINDESVEFRSVSELANGEVTERNPEGLSVEDLKWGITIGNSITTIGINERNVVYPPRDISGNTGNTFLFIKAANGNYVPVYVKPTMYNEIKDGKLKQRIDTLLNDLSSTDKNTRIKAREELKSLLSFNAEKSIVVSDNAITVITNNGISKKSFAIGENFDRALFMKTVKESKFRINITVPALQSTSAINELSEAGALNVDIAKLGTSNSIFDVYPCKEDGTPVITEDATWSINESSTGEELRKDKHSVLMEGNTYREVDGKFYNELNKEITDPETIQKLAYAQEISNRQLTPSFTKDDIAYYVLKEGESPVVVKIESGDKITVANEETSKKAIDFINKTNEAKAKAEAAKNALNRPNVAEDTSLQDVNLEDEILTTEQIEQQMFGNFGDVDLAKGTTQKPSIAETTSTPVVAQHKADINSSDSNVINSLHNSKNCSTFAEIYRNRDTRNALKEIFKAKGWELPATVGKMSEFLKSKNVSVEGISDVNSWLQMIKDCR